ncbi:MAG: zinc-ribbon domain-containing protein [Thermoplasmata archaeon]
MQVGGKSWGNCGRQNPLEASFCNSCGTAFGKETGGISQ